MCFYVFLAFVESNMLKIIVFCCSVALVEVNMLKQRAFLLVFDACVNFRLLSPSTGFFLFFVAQKGVRISGIPSTYLTVFCNLRSFEQL